MLLLRGIAENGSVHCANLILNPLIVKFNYTEHLSRFILDYHLLDIYIFRYLTKY